jgi:drug/metabolite transporter (DMT)-like permease
MLYEGLLVLSEAVLSAYPLLIKLTDTTIYFQTGLRMIIYTVLAVIAAQATGSPLAAATLFSSETIATGLLNLVHVVSSYTAFDKLAGGNAMALFYTYPVWNILGASALLKESIPMASLPWIGLALVGAIMLAQPSTTNWTMVGVIAALVAAITETGIYLWFRSSAKDDKKETKEGVDEDQPWTKMIQMYGSSGVFWLVGTVLASVFGLLAKGTFDITGKGLAGIVLFNSLVGFVGYAMRFYIVPKVSTVAFSALSFVGIIAAYGLSWLFADEVPTMVQALGAAAIIVANTVLVSKETV